MAFDARQGWFSNRDEPEQFVGQNENLASFVSALTLELQRKSANLILGTDAEFGGAVPGYAVHEELQALVDSGLSELQALQTATLNVGDYLNVIDPKSASWGQIQPGFEADLLLIGGNPLVDIASTREIRGMMVNGQWFDAGEFQSIDRQLADKQESLLPLARQFEEALVAGDIDAATDVVASVPADLAEEPLINAENCIFLGYRHFYGGNRPLAGQLYELCARMHPDSSPLWIHIGMAAEQTGDTEKAIDAYAKASGINPWYRDPVGNIGRLNGAVVNE
ncbi:MAG TPA: amidohydrolase family protein [Xanthomonadales bacterium]|nr:amidohydrolase family protein [Xanthomonadales bacterium]